MVLSRDLARSKQFYQEGLGLKLLCSSETFAEFDIQASVPLCVKLAQRLVCYRDIWKTNNFVAEILQLGLVKLLVAADTRHF